MHVEQGFGGQRLCGGIGGEFRPGRTESIDKGSVPTSATLGIGEGIVGDPMQPRPDGGVPTETIDCGPRGREDLLRQVLGQMRLARQETEKAIDGGVVGINDDFVRLATALSKGGDNPSLGSASHWRLRSKTPTLAGLAPFHR
jgi:hypothetical protein